MANLETFSKANMASEFIQSYVGTTKYQDSSEYAEIHDGALVVLGDLAEDEVYKAAGEGIVDYNTFLSKKPGAATDPVVVVDIAGVTEGVIAGNTYRIGSKLVGLKAQPGTPVRFRRLAKGDMFWASEDCFASKPTVKQYAIPTASSTKWTPNASNPDDGSVCIKIAASRELTVGNTAASTMYLCIVE